ncbi:hypothetical protein NKR23_g10813 [Pleurostoma richardsiae]|uniref:Uncharacterized protein n=1 Tax=Pleurostoma richardsiae TaxID=41990 RepID=A0AA38RL61_9PEZI|nr:hypothetical protein NKR23_g10813 [Pleurostoma richardsiae]
MFFLRLYRKGKRETVRLTDVQYKLFFKGLLRPSFSQIGIYFQYHVPGSYESVRTSSMASVEATGSSAARGSNIDVDYNEENLQ